MGIGKYLKRGFRYVRSGVPVQHTTADVYFLHPGETLKGKKIIVTGGGRGLGFAMARKFTEEGADVLISGRNEETLKDASEKIGCSFLPLDVMDIGSFEDFIRRSDEMLGGVNVLVNNAGISLHEKSFMDVTPETFDRQINTNLRGGFFLAQKFVTLLREKNRNGSILFTSSETGGTDDIRPYGWSKAAVNSMVRDTMYGKTLRKSFAKMDEIEDMPNLLEIQKKSYQWFLDTGLREVFRDVAAIFRTPCVPSLLFVESCGFFVFAAVGNLIPFRMLELGQGDSESLIGLMYLGYMVGFFASSCLGVLRRLFGTTTRLILAGSLLYMLSAASMAAPNLWVLFYGIFFMTFGEFLVHVNIPGIVNRLTERHDRGMVNGLFLSCYYFGGVLGTLVPSLAYTRFGWTAAYGTMQAILCMAFLVLLALQRRLPETH